MKTADEIQISYAESKGFGNFDLLIEKEVSALDYHVQKVQEIYADQFKPKWISVKDALPEIGTMNLWFVDDEMGVGFYDGLDELACTHWMPLPNPPEI